MKSACFTSTTLGVGWAAAPSAAAARASLMTVMSALLAERPGSTARTVEYRTMR